ncbi:MAG: hypothetical protein O9264_15825 [Leptospira sp.]|nr:hypothetical protein [Leptospira sp.]
MIKKVLFHLTGFGLIIGGWFICIINVGLDRGANFKLFSTPNLVGLTLILIGAYFPEITTKFFGQSSSKE